MAPEQAKGREADKRSDVWAFGCVLYEMLTGRRAFDGEDVAEVLGAVVRLEPNWDALRSDVPPPIRTLLQRCLVKDRRKRIGDIAAAHFVLDHQASVATTGSLPVRSNRMAWLVAALATIVAIAMAIVTLRFYDRTGALAPEVVQFTIAPPEKTVFGAPTAGGTGIATQLAISPDGRHIVFVAGAQSAFQLWLRPVAGAEARPIQGTEGGTFPFWSPDSRFIAYFAGGQLKRVAIDGGPLIMLADAPAGRGGTWSRDNVIVFDRAGSGLFRVPSAGGSPTAVTMLADGEDAHRWPHFLPDGRHFLYTAVTGACCPAAKPGTIRIGSLDPAEPVVTLLQADSSATYAAGRMVFARDETLMARAFDPVARQLVGDAVPVIERVRREGSRYVSASVSEQGTLVYAHGGASLPYQLTWFDRAGGPAGTLGEAALDANLALSPDERQVALALRSGSPGNLDIWTIDIARNLRNRVTSDPLSERSPVWSPDGKRIAFGGPTFLDSAVTADKPAKAVLFQAEANGTAPKEVLVAAEGIPSRPCAPLQCGLTPSDWSPDGRHLLYTFSGSFPATQDIWALPLSGDRKPFPVVQTGFNESLAVFSPNGRWIAYMTNETGQYNIYVQPFLRPGGKYRISPNGGRDPHWRADGKELFYLDTDGAMTAVPVEVKGETFEAGLPKTLFGAGVISLNRMYAVTRDGQRFLVNARPPNTVTTAPLTVIVNWASTLQK